MRILRKNSKWQHCTSCPFLDFSECMWLPLLCKFKKRSSPFKIFWMVRFSMTVSTCNSSSGQPSLLDLQLSFYRPLCYNSRAHCPLLQCLRTTSAILAGAHSYFVVSSFKCEGNNSHHDLIPNPLLQCLRTSSAILAGAHSYFVVSSFKCEGNNSCHDLIPNHRRKIIGVLNENNILS